MLIEILAKKQRIKSEADSERVRGRCSLKILFFALILL
jgi:hypothetical protein